MYLYRAINKVDEEKYRKGEDITCNLIRHQDLDYIKKEVFFGDVSLILDRTIGHVSGKNIMNSCWVSTSSELLFTISEFAIPQSGRYNIDLERKNIIVIEVDKSDEIIPTKYLREDINLKKISGKYLDLSNDNLQKYVTEGYIKPLSANEKSYFEKAYYSISYDSKEANVKGISNFATWANEHLFYNGIRHDKIKYILNPLEQDLIYVLASEYSNMKLEYIVDYVKNTPLIINTLLLSDIEKNIYNYLYQSISNKYNNLIDLIPKLFETNQKHYNIIELYDFLKEVKRKLITKLIKQLYCINITKNIDLPDDKIFTTTEWYYNKKMINENKKITPSNINDIIYIQDSKNNIKRKIIKNS